MGGFKDLTNQRFGLLTAIQRVGTQKGGHILWDVICDCGTVRRISGNNLRQGNSTSCGCSRWGAKGEAGFNNLLRVYKRTCARSRGLPFELTDNQFRWFTSQNCCFCGQPPSQVSVSDSRTNKAASLDNSKYVYSGLDRWDNNKGYVLGNVVPACKWCNRGKWDRSGTEFLEWWRSIGVPSKTIEEVLSKAQRYLRLDGEGISVLSA